MLWGPALPGALEQRSQPLPQPGPTLWHLPTMLSFHSRNQRSTLGLINPLTPGLVNPQSLNATGISSLTAPCPNTTTARLPQTCLGTPIP